MNAAARIEAAGAEVGDDAEPGRLTIYSALVPALPLREAAERFAAREGVAVEVKAGRPERWMSRLRDGAPADLICCGAEFLVDLAEAEGLVDGASRRSVGSRRAAIVVPAGNPAGVASVADLARPDVALGISVEGCTLGLWDEIATRAGLTEVVRARIAERARGCGALLGVISRGAVDAAVGWHNFDRVPGFSVEVVPPDDGFEIRRSTCVAVTRGCERREPMERFVAYLVSEEGRAIYRRWGWDVE